MKEKSQRAVETAKEVVEEAADSAKSFYIKTFEGRPANDQDLHGWGELDYPGETLEKAVARLGLKEGDLIQVTVDWGRAVKLTGTVTHIRGHAIDIQTVGGKSGQLFATSILRSRKNNTMLIRKLKSVTDKEYDRALKAEQSFDTWDDENDARARQKAANKEKKERKRQERLQNAEEKVKKGNLAERIVGKVLRAFTEEDWEYLARQDRPEYERRKKEMEAEEKYWKEKAANNNEQEEVA